MTFDEWKAEPYARTFEDAWKAGAASRDAEVAELVEALEKISAIEDQMYGADWEEIEEAREIADEALAKVRKP